MIFENEESPIIAVLTGDMNNYDGEPRNHTGFSLLNKTDEATIFLHSLVLSAGSDSVQNTKVTHRDLATQIREFH